MAQPQASAGLTQWILTALLWLAIGTTLAWAGAPEYMKLDATVGMALEVEGHWDTSGVFVADDIEVLPRPRSPKLRGQVRAVDPSAGSIVMFGQQIAVGDGTEMVADGGTARKWSDLAAGDRIEVSCKVDSASGLWRARKIRAHGVKSSDKVKGTITRFHIDGTAPDTLSLSGLKILLVRATDILRSESFRYPTNRELFGTIGRGSIEAMPRGWPLSSNMNLAVQYRMNVFDESDFDLSSSTQTDFRATEHQIRTGLTAIFSREWAAYGHLRLRRRFFLMNDQNLPPDDFEADITQLYALYQPRYLEGIVGHVGRQRFREPREWIFDEYQDAVRLYYTGSAPLVVEAAYIHAVNPIKEKFTTWTDYFVRIRWYTDPHSRLAAYVLARRDSDASRRRQPVWWGIRYLGRVTNSVSSWADLVLQRGEDKLRPVQSYAVDLGTTVTAVDVAWKPAVTLGYAKGSGDETNADATDYTFRQTGYEDNVARLSGRGRTKYYGNLLDPELSNLEVYTLSVGIQPYRDGSLELIYHSYSQDYPDDDLRGSGLVDPPARPNGVSTDIGWAVDFVIRVPRLWNALGMRWTLAMFNPGEAFSPRQANAYFGRVNVTLGV